jgi:membrane-bound lytic murein transglycosylase A
MKDVGLWLYLALAPGLLASCKAPRTAPTSNDATSHAFATQVVPIPDAAASPGTATPCPTPDLVAPPEQLVLSPTTFSQLPGWADDLHHEAIPALLASCSRLAKLGDQEPIGVDGNGGLAGQWRAACAAAAALPAGNAGAARRFFEEQFVPYAAAGSSTGAIGKFTGYYVQELRGSRSRHGPFQIPVHGRPADLVEVNLQEFLPDAHGRKIWGRVDARARLVPYPTRAELRTQHLVDRGRVLLWVTDPIDVLFAQIQGSARAQLDDGSTMWLEFAGKNGRPYRGVGKRLRDMGEPPGTGTMQGIRAWLEAHPERFDELVDHNESFVFFAESQAPGAVGSQGVVLTPRRSVAVDRAHVAASTPLWIETSAPRSDGSGSAPWRQLVVAQDTGGGIKGPVRADIFWGDDPAAAEIAGRMGDSGRYWLLLPPGVPVPAK